MSAAGRSTEAAVSDLVGPLREAGFVRLVGAANADSVAAVGLLADALDTSGVPYQSSITPLAEPADRSTDADLTIAVGRRTTDSDLTIGLDGAAAKTAHAVARDLGAGDLALALAGTVARNGHPGEELATLAGEHGIERRPGVAVPTADLADGLAHSTLVHAPFSGELTAVEQRLESLDAETAERNRAVASAVALAVAGDPDGTPRGSEAVERVLRPLAGGPFETIGGYADVLDALARERSSLALALALGRIDDERALQCWRQHATASHEAIRQGTTSRYDGLYILQYDGAAPVGTVARLVSAYRSPEPVTLVVDSGQAAVSVRDEATTDPMGALESATAAVGGESGTTPQRGCARFETDPTEFVAAFTEAV